LQRNGLIREPKSAYLSDHVVKAYLSDHVVKAYLSDHVFVRPC